MKPTGAPQPSIAIACGGTGGHLFPGLAIADPLVRRGCAVTLLISPKDVDQQAVKQAAGVGIVTLAAVGLSRGRLLAFARGFVRSYRASRNFFREQTPAAVLAMGGFTSAPPVLAAKRFGARTFLHESNTIPGRANRWLARVVDEAFVGFPQAAARLRSRKVDCTGTPVRSQFQPADPAACRVALGLDPDRPTLLVMGGSQGAQRINELLFGALALPTLLQAVPGLQVIHLTGNPEEAHKMEGVFASQRIKGVACAFLADMEHALGAATVAVSRAGASSLAEFAAMRVPAVLIPFPAAADRHQLHNARAFEETGAARLLEQKAATPETLSRLVAELFANRAARESMQAALAKWHAPDAAVRIAEEMLRCAACLVPQLQPEPERGDRSRPHPGATGRQSFSAV